MIVLAGFGLADVEVLLFLGKAVPQNIPAADANLQVFLLLGIFLCFPELIGT